jgi:hypothetical protein
VLPAYAGVPVTIGGATGVSDGAGVARLHVANFAALPNSAHVPETTVAPGVRVRFDRLIGVPSSGRPITVGLDVWRQIRWKFLNGKGALVPPAAVDMMRLRSSSGQLTTLRGAGLAHSLWLQATRVYRAVDGVHAKKLYYNIDAVQKLGGDLVYHDQQKFFPYQDPVWAIHLTYFTLTVKLSDWLFRTTAGPRMELTRPDGSVVTRRANSSGIVTFPALPRGKYEVRVPGAALKANHPVALSTNSSVDVRVVTRLDVLFLGVVLAVLAIAPLVGGAWWRRRKRDEGSSDDPGAGPQEPEQPLPPGPAYRSPGLLAPGHEGSVPSGPEERKPELQGTRHLRARFGIIGATLLASTIFGSTAGHAAAVQGTRHASYPTPVLAYYYIWFNPTSWNRAKLDYPLVGRYSSDDPKVMAEQIREAQAAGITGFLVSWKSTPDLNRRLRTLIQVADAAHFHLGLVYEGLDFNRDPLPVSEVETGLRYFASHFASDPAFKIFDKPLAIWTGTWDYSTAAVRQVTASVRSKLLVLGSAREVVDYQRIQRYVDGNAYYWSSVTPSLSWYPKKLRDMSRAVHDHGGLWVAPAAAAFDARLIGGHIVVPRNGGGTLRKEWAVAAGSNPDAIGLISWNEFSENSYIEPSVKFGTSELKTVASLTGHEPSVIDDPDSSAYTTRHGGSFSAGTALAVIGGVAVIAIAALAAVRRRLWRRDGSSPAGSEVMT